MDFGISPALSTAVATHADSAGTYITAASFDAAVRGSKTAAPGFFPAPRPQDGTLDFSIAPALPAAVATRDDSAEKHRADANFNTADQSGDAFTWPSSTGDAPKPTTLVVSTRTNRGNRLSIAPPSGVDARSPSARSARRMARHALITARQVAEAQAAATATTASSLHDPGYH